MELSKVICFVQKTPLFFLLLKEYIFYKKTIIERNRIVKKIKTILKTVLSVKQTNSFIKQLNILKDKLNEDALFAYKNDPSFHSLEETIITSPGLFAILVYRVANSLYLSDVKIIPRLLSEYAHSKTGIDINPEAEIGRNFFIDHGTGVVIGATTFIGNNVKLYHGVTLGAKSLKNANELKNKKRHPTILSDVTIYSNSTVLGGDTVVGEGCIIGTNKIVTESIPSGTKVI